MAALTVDRVASKKAFPQPVKVPRGVKGGVVIYRNSVVGVRADTGMVEPLDGAGDYSQVLYSTEKYDNADGADGDVRGIFLRDITVELNSTGLTEAANGDVAYGTTDNDFVLVQGVDTEPEIGKVNEYIAANKAYVHIP